MMTVMRDGAYAYDNNDDTDDGYDDDDDDDDDDGIGGLNGETLINKHPINWTLAQPVLTTVSL